MAKRAKALRQAGSTTTVRARAGGADSGRPDFECVALLLQGGGALGAYQGGVYEALAERAIHPDWVAGISIGAINSAIIAGNPPEQRVAKLRAFWEQITANWSWPQGRAATSYLVTGEGPRKVFNQASAAASLSQGAPGFFAPRVPAPWVYPDGSLEATSWYETGQLRRTLERLVDFDRLNNGETRVSLGAVDVRSGNFVYFDTATGVIGPKHVLASGALPPGFPAIEIEGRQYWDGGLVSNTPLQWVLQDGPRQDTLAFQVDLWNAQGDFPRNLAEVATRLKEITYSSRTRNETDRFTRSQKIRHAVAKLLEQLPEEFKECVEGKLLHGFGDHKVYNLVHLIYRAQNYEGDSKDYEFSRLSMDEHWRAGYRDTVHALKHPEALARPTNIDGISIFDFAAPDEG
ncbi:MAG TPA: patatin-like phospholipase family protein [Stellaceae bacterium]|nr:patatin-like phospholipase family protein [Stellaceae bacterium]